MKKRVLAIVFSILMLVICFASCGKNTDVPKGMKLAVADGEKENPTYTMYVPEEWEVIPTGSNATLAQAKDKFLNSPILSQVTVNATVWGIDNSVAGDNDKAFKKYFEDYQTDMKATFDEFYVLTDLSAEAPVNTSPYREDAREYVTASRFGDVYYKYHITVIIYNASYYVITFTFPQNNLDKIEKWEDAKFDDDKYSDEIEDIVSNFKPKQ